MKLSIFKEDNVFRNIILALGIVTGFIFIVAFSSLYVSDAIQNNNACGCIIPIPWMIITLSSLGIFVGSISYYIIASHFLKEKKSINENIDLTLDFLESNEKKVVRELIKSNSSLKQTELQAKTGFNKVKIHRIINKLLAKNIVDKHSQGKIKKIELKKDIKDVFS